MSESYAIGIELEEFLRTQVASGRYNSTSDVMREALRLLQERDAWLTSVHAGLREGLLDIEAGDVCDIGQAVEEIIAEVDALPQRQTV